jgi:hypothetical protein
MSTANYILVIGADRSVRVGKKPRLAWDEVGVRIAINFPEGWGKVIGNITVDAPEFDPNVTYVPVEA